MRDPATAPIVLDDALRERIAAAFDVPGVVAALVIGSQATGRASRSSDLDLAVWTEPGLPSEVRWELRLKLLDEIAALARSDAIDLVVLNDAPPLLQHRALRDGRMILERDRVQRVRLDTRAVLDYLDTEPLRAERARGLRQSMEEDTHGRRR